MPLRFESPGSMTSSLASAKEVRFQKHHFTGKERDTESGNDYFGARYYASSMGRFLSPDWSAKYEPVPYAKLDDPQTLNLYAYVRNNPLSRVDVDGHGELWDKFKAIFIAKVNAGVGFKLEGELGKHAKAGAEAFAGVEKKFTSEGSETSLKAELKGGIQVGPVSGITGPSVEKQIEKNGEAVDRPTEFKFEKPHIGGEAGGASGEVTNELSITAVLPLGEPQSMGGTLGIDLDKAGEFGSALMQKTVDSLFNLVVPNSVPITPPPVEKPSAEKP